MIAKLSKKNGFSGIELTIIIAVLSIIGAVGIPALNCIRRMIVKFEGKELLLDRLAYKCLNLLRIKVSRCLVH